MTSATWATLYREGTDFILALPVVISGGVALRVQADTCAHSGPLAHVALGSEHTDGGRRSRRRNAAVE